ncbi:contact-dependent growth inhibition system immunity protein [Rhizobium leucaenae]|uniref:CdiI immunity protein domain-containing protein n=1 Tax=Rhizobium leucaenae TaxID=29450 RepID=A0A7W6ZZT4_9HYPH|nr:contact-dependent growth inhibition system immunity protein [Rhizobium leucaenae]MBB4571776.1 hypothetical protein [Rhizobium leucaenae]
MTDIDRNHPARQFFGAYFHQDWSLIYDSYQAAIDDFVREASAQQLNAVLDLIEPYLQSGNCEDFDMSKYGGNYRPEGDGLSKRAFLTAIRRSIHRKIGIVDVDKNHPAMQFFGGYFHQDWKLVYNSYRDVIADFVGQASLQQLDAVLEVISPYLASGSCEDFDISLFGGNYHPEDDGISKFDFLSAIKQSVEKKREITSQEPDGE